MSMELKKAWRERWRRRERKRQEISRKAFAFAEAVAERLKNGFQCEEVYLIGSLARREFNEDSDIDLVVKGLKPEDFFRAAGEFLLSGEFPVDLIPYEEAGALIRDCVESEGVRLR